MFDENIPDDDDEEEGDEGLDEATAAVIADFRLRIARLEAMLQGERDLLAEILRSLR